MFNPLLYNTPYHSKDISGSSFLITGGAGFIGSNLVEYLLRYNAKHVRVMDNISTGNFDNLRDFVNLSNFELIEKDIRDPESCRQAVDGIDYISHQAALGSVPRSIADPLTTNQVNISGFLNMLVAAKDSPVLKRFIYAASSSTYGDSPELPKVEGREGNPLSPYAVTKMVNEEYATVFGKVYGFNAVGLRYFNVFGPKQDVNGAYAAVIPLFCKSFLEKKNISINGDGETTRDFTFVENVVQANIKALLTENIPGEAFNVACGERTSLNQVVSLLEGIAGYSVPVIHKEERTGDVRHSLASTEKIRQCMGYEPTISFKTGLKIVYEWYQSKL